MQGGYTISAPFRATLFLLSSQEPVQKEGDLKAKGASQYCEAPLFYDSICLDIRFRVFGSRYRLRRRIDFGVTSTNSSSAI